MFVRYWRHSCNCATIFQIPVSQTYSIDTSLVEKTYSHADNEFTMTDISMMYSCRTHPTLWSTSSRCNVSDIAAAMTFQFPRFLHMSFAQLFLTLHQLTRWLPAFSQVNPLLIILYSVFVNISYHCDNPRAFIDSDLIDCVELSSNLIVWVLLLNVPLTSDFTAARRIRGLYLSWRFCWFPPPLILVTRPKHNFIRPYLFFTANAASLPTHTSSSLYMFLDNLQCRAPHSTLNTHQPVSWVFCHTSLLSATNQLFYQRVLTYFDTSRIGHCDK